MKSDIASIRQEYLLTSLDEQDMDRDPVLQFQRWFQEAVNASVEDVNAMTLSTADRLHQPKSRIVLLKDIEQNQFVFYTNYHSRKGQQMETNPQVSLNFFWKELQRQVSIEGSVSKTSEQDSTAYFHSRPVESQIGAWASYQSEILESREALQARFEALKEKYAGVEVPKPPHWGGFSVVPDYMEFWQGRANRLHDRVCYQKAAENEWLMQRLNP